MSKKLTILLLIAFLLPAVLVACSPTEEAPAEEPAQVEEPQVEAEAEEPEAEAEEEVAEEPEEPSMLDSLQGLTVTFWHVWGQGLPNETMLAIVDEFNATNEYGITVEALDQGRYSDAENAMNAGIQSGDLPNSTVGYTNALASWYSVDALVDLNQFVEDEEFGLSDEELAALYQGPFDGGVLADGVRVGYPISQSANVLYYNTTWAQELGFESPPATAAEFKEQACAAAAFNEATGDPDLAGTGGLVMFPSTSNFMSWLFAFDGGILNDAGDGYDFSQAGVKETIIYLKDLVDSGCTLTTESYPNPEFAGRKALFVMSSTAGLPYQIAAFEDIESADQWAFIPFPGPDGKLSVDAFGQYVGIVRSNPEQELATWLFLKYLTSPEAQAQWIEGSAYFPTQSTTSQYLDDYAAENPIWGSGLALAELGESEPNLASWSTVRRAIGDSFAAALQAADEAGIDQVLAELQTTADELVAETD